MYRLVHCTLALFAAACGDIAQTEIGPSHDKATEVSPEPVHPRAPHDDGALRVSADFSHPDCDRRLLAFEMFRAVRPDNTEVATPQCSWSFDDGQTSSACAGDVVFARAGVHGFHVRVTDPETSLTGELRGDTIVYEPLAVEVRAELLECKLSFALTTAVNQPAFSVAEIRPGDRIVGDPLIFGPVTNHVVDVTSPGTFEIEYFAQVERTTGPICSARETILVDVPSCEKCD